MKALVVILLVVGQLLEGRVHNDTYPMMLVVVIFNLQAYMGVLTEEIQFFPWHREDV